LMRPSCSAIIGASRGSCIAFAVPVLFLLVSRACRKASAAGIAASRRTVLAARARLEVTHFRPSLIMAYAGAPAIDPILADSQRLV
jgi:hypothetical protein